jgi:hypothetical protein
MVAGLETITSGEIAIDGRVVNKLEPKDRLARRVYGFGDSPRHACGRDREAVRPSFATLTAAADTHRGRLKKRVSTNFVDTGPSAL